MRGGDRRRDDDLDPPRSSPVRTRASAMPKELDDLVDPK